MSPSIPAPAVRALASGLVAAAILAACSAPGASPATSATPGGSAAASPTGGPSESAASGSIYDTQLAGVCPDPVVIQTNWYPQADHGFSYQLIGPGGTVDAQNLTYTGPLANTGVQLEVRAGGPAIGFQQVTSVVYQDDAILLGYIGTDEAIQNSESAPTTAVFAPYDRNPQAFIWGEPSWDFESVAEIGEAGATVLAFEGSTYLDVFTQQGLLEPEQIDTSYQGGAARFVTEQGRVVQQAFVTNEPYAYEHEVEEWGKPVKYLLVDDFPVYQNALAIRTDKLDANRACLEALVPLLQQAHVDYAADPGPVNELLVDYVAQLQGGGFTLSAEAAAASSELQRELELVSNGDDDTIGDFEAARIQGLIDDLAPVFAAQNKAIKEGLTPSDIATNEFLDESIELPEDN